MPETSDLTGKQKRFCEEYIRDYNASRAAREAGYSDNTAGEIGYENLKKPEIKAFIRHLQENLAETAGISKLMVLEEYKKMAFSSIANLHNSWIERKEFDELTEAQKACIAEIQTQTRTIVSDDGEVAQVEFVKIKLFDKQKALDAITKLLGFDPPKKVEFSIPEKQVIKIGGKEVEF